MFTDFLLTSFIEKYDASYVHVHICIGMDIIAHDHRTHGQKHTSPHDTDSAQQHIVRCKPAATSSQCHAAVAQYS